jgi:Uma2 family endonuclease
MTQLPVPYRFDVEGYHQMAQAGILTQEHRVELLDGIIVSMPPIGSRHAWCVSRLTRLFTTLGGESFVVWAQNPIVLGDNSEPQPDIAILDTPANPEMLPKAADVVLIIEVADTSTNYDRSTKGRLYAESGIAEYWIVDLTSDRIDVFREPRAGGYGMARSVRRGETVTPINVPVTEISADEVLG